MLDYVINHFKTSAAVKAAFAGESAAKVVEASELVARSFQLGGKLLLCGNGGSAADCQHIAAEFVSVLNQDFPRKALPAVALTTDTSFLTARANDFGFADVFARQVEALGRPEDVLLGISTSGNSENVVLAFAAARKLGIKTVGFTGRSGGKMKDTADLVLCAPHESVQHIQECHIAIGHVLVALVEKILFMPPPL